MTELSSFSAADRWRAAAVMGLISSTFSTIVSHLAAGRFGRDAYVDWMVVGSIALRDLGLQAEPTLWNVLAGLLVHQAADFSWDIVFFFLLSRWSYRLGPWGLLGVAIPWAIFTSGIEWMLLVPVVPFWWPIFTLEQAWWLGVMVHLTAASTYPFFPVVRDIMTGRRPLSYPRFTATWGALAVLGLALLAALALSGESGRELPHMGEEVAFDQNFMVDMAAHHSQGMELATLASQRAIDPHLRAIARMMIATQSSEIRILKAWWRSWFGGELPVPTPQQHAQMIGMIPAVELEELRHANSGEFDALFIRTMSEHHSGAILMADAALQKAADPRLRIMSHAIRHQQQGEINLMRGISGIEAVHAATRAMFGVDAGTASSPQHGPDAAHR